MSSRQLQPHFTSDSRAFPYPGHLHLSKPPVIAARTLTTPAKLRKPHNEYFWSTTFSTSQPSPGTGNNRVEGKRRTGTSHGQYIIHTKRKWELSINSTRGSTACAALACSIPIDSHIPKRLSNIPLSPPGFHKTTPIGNYARHHTLRRHSPNTNETTSQPSLLSLVKSGDSRLQHPTPSTSHRNQAKNTSYTTCSASPAAQQESC